MKTNLTKLAVALASVGALAGCGDDATQNNADVPQPNVGVQTELSVQAMDGYLQKAQVWLDVNRNFKLDANEPQALTGEQGKAALDLSEFNGDPAQYPLMTRVLKGQTIDEDNPEVAVTRDYLMMAPEGSQKISPVTTLIGLKMAEGATAEEALAVVRSELALPDLSPEQDYIAEKNTLLADSARALAQLLPEQLRNNSVAEHLENLSQGAETLGKAIAEQRKNNQAPNLNGKTLHPGVGGKPVLANDSDGDGVADEIDAFPNDPLESADFDQDQIGDHADLDDDGDGWNDTDELRLGSDPYDAKSTPADLDGDMIADADDEDIDGDGWSNADEIRLGTDSQDPSAAPADLDGDRVADVEDTDVDGDGADNTQDLFPRDRFESQDTNGDGLGDFASSDDDGDGIPDSLDPEPKSPNNTTDTDEPAPQYTEAVIHYKRDDGNYEGWGLHLWNNDSCDSIADSALAGVSWGTPFPVSEVSNEYGAVYRLPLKAEHGSCLNFILHKGDTKALGGNDLQLDLTQGNQIYTFDGNSTLYYEPVTEVPVMLSGASAHWLGVNELSWHEQSGATHYALWANPKGNGDINQPAQFEQFPLTLAGTTNHGDFPHLTGRAGFTLDVDAEQAKALLKQQLIAVALDENDKVLAATKVQSPGVVDALYTAGAEDADEARLGSWLEDGQAQFALWAPTATAVELYLYGEDKTPLSDSPLALIEDPATGIWRYTGTADLKHVYYRYRIKAYHPKTAQVEWMSTTDPYSLSLSTNSRYSQLVDLSDPATKPAGWDEQMIPTLTNPEDNIVYEVHIRDFSASDSKGTPAYDGKYLAFTEEDRDSVSHLKQLKAAGLTTVHLLPSYDLASITEDEAKRVDLNDTVGKLCELNPDANLCQDGTPRTTTILELLEQTDPATDEAQALMADIRPLDSFNWGYDPFHYSAPEGSYAVASDGITRIKEYRQMIQKLHELGFRVVQDVVYNHTYSSGLYDKSVLDKTVPGYYHRLNAESGAVENSTCCDNTASENRMFEKLVADSVVMWAQDYKIDGFRFDLMGHLMKSSMEKVYAEVKAVDPDSWFYGEGWNFGEVVNGTRGENATQWPMAGTGIGTYNDRLRDGVRGGGPFDSGDALLQTPGFANAGDRFDAALMSRMDLIRYGMAGNLQSYPLVTYSGMTVSGRDFKYGDQGAAYTLDPQESINYVSKHDNQTLWDFNQYKAAADVSVEDRARMQIVGLAPVMLGQGIPFLHMGSELLRSKSMARDSYDSGDWVNRVDFSKQTNNWNVGLPRADKDQANWDAIKQIIANPNTVAGPQEIAWTDARFKELLQIRAGTPLLKLINEQEVLSRVRFHNTGPDAAPGMIVMSVDDGVNAGADLDGNYQALVVAVNANLNAQSITIDGTSGFELHPVLANSGDSKVGQASFSEGTFTIPGLTAVVFVKPQAGEQGEGLGANLAPVVPAPYGSEVVYVRGSFNSWSADEAMQYVGDGKYKLERYFEPGVYTFKIASENWSSVNLGYAQLTAGDGSVSFEVDGENVKVTVTEQGVWVFELDASETSQPALTVKPTGQDYACYGGDDPACDLRIYQIMVESFVDGDSQADYTDGYGSSHHRGDLQGIIDSLDYIRSLNVNAIWLTPVFDSCAGEGGDLKLDATGYFACDYFNVDPNFGTKAQLKTLIDQAHAKGMYVFLDGVFGHTNINGVKPSPTGKQPTLKAGADGYPGQLVVYPDSNSVEFFQEVATYWIKEFGIDGWRLDQAYQLPLAQWREIRSAVDAAAAENKAAGKSWGTLGYLVGETWNSAEEISRTTYGTDEAPGLSSAFHFPLRYGLVQALAVEESGAAGDATKLNASWNAMSNHPYHAMPNLMLGNHDLVRFGDLIQRGNKGEYFQRHKAAFSFMAAWSGPITFYYGDEIGDEVPDFAAQVTDNCVEQGLCDDHVARSSAKVDGVTDVTLSAEQADLKQWLTQLMAVRADNPALYKGERRNLSQSEVLYADLKTLGEQQVVYVLNVSTEPQTLNLEMSQVKPATELVDLMTGEVITAQAPETAITVPALTGRLLEVK